MFNDFAGAARPLDKIDVAQLAHRIGASEDHLQAFLNVESRSRGFDREGRPIILTEPHVFYRNLKGSERSEAVRQGLAYPRWGEKPYPRSQDDRYDWLKAAMKINQSAALKSVSWGMSQVLGENFSVVGYPSVEAMVSAFMRDEEEHVEAMVKFILANGIADDLMAERWDVVARVYNGPGYKKNAYHTKMAKEYAKLRGVADSGWAPDAPDPRVVSVTDVATLKSVQSRLRELGYYEVGKVDGIYGTKLRAGVLAFRADNGLPIIADIDEELLAELMVAEKRPISEARANTTTSDVRAEGSRQIAAADGQQAVGSIMTVGGVAGAAAKALGIEEGGTLPAVWAAVEPVVELVKANGIYLAVAFGAYIIWQAHKAKQARVEDEQEGKNVGRG